MRIAISTWHGLGDTVMLTAPLKRYSEVNPNEEIHVFTLKRFGDTSKKLLSGLPFIAGVHPILFDAWNDFDSYDEGIRSAIHLSKTYGAGIGVDAIIPTMCFKSKDEFSVYHNKMFRFAYDLNVTYTDRLQFRPILSVDETAKQEVGRFLEPYKRPYVVLHLQGGNSKKSLSNDQLPFLSNLSEGTVFEIGENIRPKNSHHVPIGLPDMEFTKALVDACDRVIAIDSIVMHIAFTFEKKTDAIFTMTPAIQVVPLWKDYASFVNFVCVNENCGKGLEAVRELK